MRIRALVPIVSLALVAGVAAVPAPASPVVLKWPPWISIEAPVNPFDPSARGAVFLVRGMFHDGTPTLRDLSGTAEGLVGGVRRTVALRFDTTSRPGVFAVRRQWPAQGAWLVRVSLQTTTALISIDASGNPAGVTVPTEVSPKEAMPLPRPVTAREIDALLASAARR